MKVGNVFIADGSRHDDVAVAAGQLRGFLAYAALKHRAEVLGFAVELDHQRREIGAVLFDQVCLAAIHRQIGAVYVNVPA